VPVIAALAKILMKFQHGKPNKGAMFPASNGSPFRLNNLLRQQILPALNRCLICAKTEAEHEEAEQKEAVHKYQRDSSRPEWRGWHAFRRGLATNLHDLEVADETIKAILRHSNVQVTQRSYIKTLPRQTVGIDPFVELVHCVPYSKVCTYCAPPRIELSS
jgi:integrase